MGDSTRPKEGGEGEIPIPEKKAPPALKSGEQVAKVEPPTAQDIAELANPQPSAEVIAAVCGSIQDQTEVTAIVVANTVSNVIDLDTRRKNKKLSSSHSPRKGAIPAHKSQIVSVPSNKSSKGAARQVSTGSLLSVSTSAEKGPRKKLYGVIALLRPELDTLDSQPVNAATTALAAKDLADLSKNKKLMKNTNEFFREVASILLLQLWPKEEDYMKFLDDSRVNKMMKIIRQRGPELFQRIGYLIYSWSRGNEPEDPLEGRAMDSAHMDAEAHPDEEEIENFPELVEWQALLEKMHPGYETVGNIYCKMRIALREKLIECQLWQGSLNEMPDRRFWMEPITVDEAVSRIENAALDPLLKKADDLEIPEDEQDEAFTKIFAIVAHNIIMMERSFLKFNFDDEFIESLCYKLIDDYKEGKKDGDGVKKIIVEKIGPQFRAFLQHQAKTRWLTVNEESRIVFEAGEGSFTT